MKIKACIIGYSGKMGKEIIKLSKNRNLKIASKVNTKNFKTLGKEMKISDIAIDFSSTEVLDEILSIAIKTKTPLVIGTTGYSKKDFDKIKKASKKIAIFYSANFSIGIFLLKKMSVFLASSLKNSKIKIEETHHILKKDKPSGTALALANEVKSITKKDPLIKAIRQGSVVGEHSVVFDMQNEKIDISHKAKKRSVFAIGAIEAAEFLHNKTNGLYSMQDLVNHISL